MYFAQGDDEKKRGWKENPFRNVSRQPVPLVSIGLWSTPLADSVSVPLVSIGLRSTPLAYSVEDFIESKSAV
jgi:hypothetical protein